MDSGVRRVPWCTGRKRLLSSGLMVVLKVRVGEEAGKKVKSDKCWGFQEGKKERLTQV